MTGIYRAGAVYPRMIQSLDVLLVSGLEREMRSKVKKMLVGLVVGALSLIAGVLPVRAASLPVIAVVDVGANTSLFTNIVTEVCIVEMLSCPNGQSFMEGKGAANTGVPLNKSIDHGTNMLSIVNKVNPSVGLIPIRIVATTSAGNPGLYTNKAVKLALDWIAANRVKYNIVAVSVSQGKIFDNCFVPDGTAAVVAALKAANVAVIGAAGNDGKVSQMMSIACLPDVISVGATDNPDPGIGGIAYCKTCAPTIAKYSNGNPVFYTNGRWYVTQGNGTTKFTVGTSNATAAFAGWWVLNYKGSIAQTMDFLIKGSGVASNAERTGKYVTIPQI